MIKAIFPEGVSAMTVNGLHQWDYGKKLQIEASGLPALVEVHFACEGMQEAVVRVCAVTNGAAVAAIPDSCLEQTSPIFAWVYLVDESSGTTTLTVTLPVIARTRPQPGAAPIPEDVSDKYTEAVAAMNEAVGAFTSGEYKVKNAYNADKATQADSATNAMSATMASKATSAMTAAYTHVSLKILLLNSDYSEGTVGDITYYYGGTKKTLSYGPLSVSEQKEYNILVDLGSNLSLSNNCGFMRYEIDDIPLVAKSETIAEGAQAYKSRFIVIGGGSATFAITEKG